MKLTFKIDYYTQLGQQVFVVGSIPQLGGGDEKKALGLNFSEKEKCCYATIDIKKHKQISYKYFVKNFHSNEVIYEGGERLLEISNIKTEQVELRDVWRFVENEKVVYHSSLFTNVLHSRSAKAKKTKSQKIETNQFQLCIEAPVIAPDERLFVIGNHPKLGAWNVKKAVEMTAINFPRWQAVLDVLEDDLQYKYFIKNNKTGKITWEEGENRVIKNTLFKEGKHLVIADENLKTPHHLWRGSGVSIPVFSLRTENSFGVGEFLDIKEMVDWAADVGMNIIQLLPINDTTATQTWLDSYPYRPISVVALHPMYLNIRKLTKMAAADSKKYNKEKKELNNLQGVDYELVNSKKWKYISSIFKKQKTTFLKSNDFQQFFKENKEWLPQYAAFCFFRNKYKTTDFLQWKENAVYKKSNIEKLTHPNSKDYDDIAIHYYVQYHLHRQLEDVVAYAKNKNVALKGDIPIGIGGESVDAWTQPQLFNLGTSAGAPPDAFATRGQNWGFPTYNWEEMEKEQFQWWKTRFRKMADYFDAYRIDHILGFFRIWEIPEGAVWGLLGHFNKALPYSTDELFLKGIHFNYHRYCKPYIKDHILYELFGEDTDFVKKTFLNHTGFDNYDMKPEFSTQKAIVSFFENSKELTAYQHTKEGVMSLLAEVLFIPDPINPALFHPRISMQNTLSFRDLDNYSKITLNAIYDEFFYKRHNQFWREQAMRKLPVLTASTDMLVCGEDLGMVPNCVNSVMKQLSILSLEIQRMPKDDSIKFGHPADAPYLSVCTTSTHDMSTIRGWWEENREESQEFYNTILGKYGEAPFYAEPWLCIDILKQHLYSPAMLTIFPLQDLLAIDGDIRFENTNEERINHPSNPEHYWKYRMHLTLQELRKASYFNETLRALIKESGR